MTLISFSKIKRSTVNSMKNSISEALELIHFSFEREIKNVVIKPNLCYYWDYSTGQTTDPRFVAALVTLIREKTSHDTCVSVVESDASAMKCKQVFRMLGYERLSQEYDFNLVNLSEETYDPVKETVLGKDFHLSVPRIIRNADLRINLPKIKYMLFGCNPYPKKFRYHPYLEEVIVAANKAMRFELCLVDGNIVSGAQPRKLGLAMAGKDLVAIDTAAARILGVNPYRIRHIRLAQKEGLGNMSFNEVGVPMSYFEERYPRRGIRAKLVSQAYRIVKSTGLGPKLGLE